MKDGFVAVKRGRGGGWEGDLRPRVGGGVPNGMKKERVVLPK